MNRISYRRHRFPAEFIQRSVWLYFRFSLSYRDVADPLAERGVEVFFETVRCWALKFRQAQHRAKLHSTNPLERLNGEIKRRSDVVGILPNEAAVTRLIGALQLEQNDEWAVQPARYMSV